VPPAAHSVATRHNKATGCLQRPGARSAAVAGRGEGSKTASFKSAPKRHPDVGTAGSIIAARRPAFAKMHPRRIPVATGHAECSERRRQPCSVEIAVVLVSSRRRDSRSNGCASSRWRRRRSMPAPGDRTGPRPARSTAAGRLFDEKVFRNSRDSQFERLLLA